VDSYRVALYEVAPVYVATVTDHVGGAVTATSTTSGYQTVCDALASLMPEPEPAAVMA
jgi:hypothetical protein